MNSITLITKRKIIQSEISEILLSNFSRSNVIQQNDCHEIFMGKYPNNFYIVFDDSISIDDDKCLLDDFVKNKISIENAQVNYLYFHKIEIAKEVVHLLSSIYPELIVFDENEFVGTAKEFINY